MDQTTNCSLFGVVSDGSTVILLNTIGWVLSFFYGIILISSLYRFTLIQIHRYNVAIGNGEDGTSSEMSAFEKSKILTRFIFEFLTNGMMFADLSNFVFGILGSCVHHFFFCYHLLDCCFSFPKLRSLLQAIWGPISSILLTLILFVSLEYLVAVVTYAVFTERFADIFVCDTLLHCFLFTVDQQFKAQVPVKSYDLVDGEEEVKLDYPGIIFDFVFFFIMMVILIEVIKALVIDTFKVLREEVSRKMEDLEGNCIICGEKSEIIEKRTQMTFQDHNNLVHNIWFYHMFIAYLMVKPEENHNGIESYVYEKFKEKNICWLPYCMYV